MGIGRWIQPDKSRSSMSNIGISGPSIAVYLAKLCTIGKEPTHSPYCPFA